MAVAAGSTRRGRKTTVVSSAVLAVIALVVTGFAIRFPGLTSSEVDVSNGGVWVLNNQLGVMGRLNVDAQELDARVSSVGEDLDILQSGYTVLEVGARGFTPINSGALTRGGVVELPPGSKVAVGGDRVAISYADGRVWILTPQEAAAFSPESAKPNFTGDKEAITNVTSEGTVHVLSGAELHVFPRTADTRYTKAQKPITISGVENDPETTTLTSVGEEPVIVDRKNRLLRLGMKGKERDLTEIGINDFTGLVAQQPGGAGDHVVIASPDSLLEVPLGGGEITVHKGRGTGDPVAPVQINGCSYAAWNGSKTYMRVCEGEDPVSEVVPEADSSADLVLRQNRDLVVLNDQKFGLSWMISKNMEIVDEWQITQEIKTDHLKKEKKETLTSTITNMVADRDEENRAPVANDDEFGVRPGKSVVLPVTRNDTDPDGDVLTVTVTGKQPGVGTVTPIRGGTQLQIEVSDTASGSASFNYTVNDGRGGTDSAKVALTVVPEGENSAPEQAGKATPKVKVRSGEEVTFNILPYWQDPDGDAFYLSNAVAEPEDIVSFRADGLITFTDAGLATGDKQVKLFFRDEKGDTAEGTLEVEAVTDSDIPPITTADHAQIVAGRSTTVKPLVNDMNPNGGKLELTHVSSSSGLETKTSLQAGTVDISSSGPGTHYLEYTVAGQGSSASSKGLIRVDVVEASSEELVPVAVDDMGMVITGSDTLIDPLENDVDPTGGVMVVNSVNVPEGSGLKATVVNHHLVRVEALPNAQVSEEPVPLEYTVANSAGSATGTIRVMVTKTDTQFANPVAVVDQAVVRAGDMVVVDVLANDVSPTESDMHLGRLSNTEEANARGHVEPANDKVRFTADDNASGEVSLTYEVVDETGRSGSARLNLRIIPRDAANNPPEPQNLTARTVAGTPVRIPVPSSGIDPDGDSVVLTGITAPMPTLGEVTKASGEWIEYVPRRGTVGTDRFRYQVMDRNGAIGTGEVLVGIAEPAAQNQPPYAVDDAIEAKPDREVQIPVLANDTDPEGGELSVVREAVEATTDITVHEHTKKNPQPEGIISVTTPEQPGTHTVTYGVTDGQLTSYATVTIKVDPNATDRAPIARDDFVEAEEVLDPSVEQLDIDVLANDSDPDGSTHALTVALDEAPEGVELTGDGRVLMAPPAELTRIRYTITDPDDLTAAGYVWVPGTAKQAPVWVGETVKAQDGASVTINLADPANVRVRPGAQPAKVVDAYEVRAENSDGSPLVTGPSELTYRPAPGYVGKDTITVEVTDGEVGDPTAATGLLAIPVEVSSEEANLPPTLQGALLEPEQAGGAATVDLARGATDPEGAALTFALGTYTKNPDIEIALNGSVLSATASTTARKGTTVTVPVSVTDGVNDPVEATVQVRVVGSKRPLISAVRDEVTINAGDTGSVDVLANDSNPFPGEERTVTGAGLVSGEGTVTQKGNQVEITPHADFHGILTAQYTVMDSTEDPDREASGEIRVTVLGRPEPPSAPRIGEVGDGSVELQFTAGADNGSPITGYKVSSASGPAVTQDCPSTSCTITGLKNDVEYTFQVVAVNEVGESDPSAPSAKARPDVRPETPSAPRATRGDQQLAVSWQTPVNRGSAIQKYELQMRDGNTGSLQTQTLDGAGTEYTWPNLANGVNYSFRVRAFNMAKDPSDWSEWSAPEHPAGRPGKPSGTLTASRVNTPTGGGVSVTWSQMTEEEANGEPIQKYIVKASSGQTQQVSADKTSTTFSGLDPDSPVTFTLTGVNSVGEGQASNNSNEVTPYAEPGTPSNVSATMPDEGSGDGPNGRVDLQWSPAPDNGTRLESYIVRWSGGSTEVSANSTSTRITGLENGRAYSFTVEAKNRFVQGQSSSASNSVTPYTKPDSPTLSLRLEDCQDNNCPITVMVRGHNDGGAGGFQEMQYQVNGGGWKTGGGNALSQRIDGPPSTTYTVEARAVNAKGLTGPSVTESATSNRPVFDPRVVNVDFYEKAGGVPNCASGNCWWFTVEIEGLEPGNSYRIAFNNKEERGWAPMTLKADPDGKVFYPRGRAYYGYPEGSGNPMRVTVDGHELSGDFYSP